MTRISIVVLSLCLALFLSCSKEQISCFTPPESIYIRFLDDNGNDLLDPANPNGYKFSDIRLHYLDEGKKTYSKVRLDSLPDSKAYFLTTDISWKADGGRNFSLQLSPTVTDNIYLRYDQVSEKQCSFFRFVELKYNNVNQNMKVIDGYFRVFEIVQ